MIVQCEKCDHKWESFKVYAPKKRTDRACVSVCGCAAKITEYANGECEGYTEPDYNAALGNIKEIIDEWFDDDRDVAPLEFPPILDKELRRKLVHLDEMYPPSHPKYIPYFVADEQKQKLWEIACLVEEYEDMPRPWACYDPTIRRHHAQVANIMAKIKKTATRKVCKDTPFQTPNACRWWMSTFFRRWPLWNISIRKILRVIPAF